MVLYSRHFFVVRSTSSSKKPDNFSPWHWQGSGSPWGKSGCGHPPVPCCFSMPLKTNPHILVFQRTAMGLFHNSFLFILLLFPSLIPFEEEKTRINFCSKWLSPPCPRDTACLSLLDTPLVRDEPGFVTPWS